MNPFLHDVAIAVMWLLVVVLGFDIGKQIAKSQKALLENRKTKQ